MRRNTLTGSQHLEKRGAIEGPIRISLDSQLSLFNALALPCISSKSLKFRSELFSIPTTPTKFAFRKKEFPLFTPSLGPGCASHAEANQPVDHSCPLPLQTSPWLASVNLRTHCLFVDTITLYKFAKM